MCIGFVGDGQAANHKFAFKTPPLARRSNVGRCSASVPTDDNPCQSGTFSCERRCEHDLDSCGPVLHLRQGSRRALVIWIGTDFNRRGIAAKVLIWRHFVAS
jgi:hypothetical protein